MAAEETITLAAEIIRAHSREGNLIGLPELAEEMAAQSPTTAPGGEPSPMDEILTGAMGKNADLRQTGGGDGQPLYFSTLYLSETYAKILARKDSPLLQISETVRENSALYPRPVPLEMFQEPPFDLKPADIQECLKMMASREEYQDIAFTTTSVGTVYLYSTRHLEHNYAAMLAERVDVGMSNNP